MEKITQPKKHSTYKRKHDEALDSPESAKSHSGQKIRCSKNKSESQIIKRPKELMGMNRDFKELRITEKKIRGRSKQNNKKTKSSDNLKSKSRSGSKSSQKEISHFKSDKSLDSKMNSIKSARINKKNQVKREEEYSTIEEEEKEGLVKISLSPFLPLRIREYIFQAFWNYRDKLMDIAFSNASFPFVSVPEEEIPLGLPLPTEFETMYRSTLTAAFIFVGRLQSKDNPAFFNAIPRGTLLGDIWIDIAAQYDPLKDSQDYMPKFRIYR
jgi:hypothetical protein